MRISRLCWLVVALVTLARSPIAASTGSTAPYLIIVHPGNPATTLERRFVSDSFLKKATRWPDDQVIRPVDLGADSPVRRAFSEGVLRRSVSAVKSYWQQQIFSGRDVPPPELDSDEQVLRFVSSHPGAVGYLSGSSRIDGVKLVTVR